MNNYIVSVWAKLYTTHRVVQANSKAEAIAQVGQEGARLVWVEISQPMEDWETEEEYEARTNRF